MRNQRSIQEIERNIARLSRQIAVCDTVIFVAVVIGVLSLAVRLAM